jgi:hypothetical protein
VSIFELSPKSASKARGADDEIALKTAKYAVENLWVALTADSGSRGRPIARRPDRDAEREFVYCSRASE